MLIITKQSLNDYNALRIRDFYDLGQNYKNSLSLSGGTAKTNYFLSLSQNSSDGVVPTDHDSYKRYTIAARGSHQAKNLTVSSSVNFSTEKKIGRARAEIYR